MNKKIVVTGGAGFLGKHVVEELIKKGYRKNEIFIPRSKDYDLRKQNDCVEIVKGAQTIIHLAANVGGIGYNAQNPGSLFYDNITMGVHLIEEARKANVDKFVAIGTVCAYPKFTPTPFKEDDLWNGYPEETNAPYGIAKKALLVQAQAYRQQYSMNAIYLLPVNLYGPGDNFDPKSSHVIPALIRKFVEAESSGTDEVEVWGIGKATREFLYVADAAKAIVEATENYDGNEPVNIGSSEEISIKDLANLIKEATGFKGKIVWDTSKPDGQPARKLDTSRAEKEFGWKSSTDFNEGIRFTIEWFKKNNK